jgi:hypothetical protein
MNIPTKFGSNQSCGFREDKNVKAYGWQRQMLVMAIAHMTLWVKQTQIVDIV